jgi:putative addiction module CopG family antidote
MILNYSSMKEFKCGAYEYANEVIRASLRLLKARDDGMEALRQEILLGVEDIQTGRFTTCASDEELEAFSDEIALRRAHKLIPKPVNRHD